MPRRRSGRAAWVKAFPFSTWHGRRIAPRPLLAVRAASEERQEPFCHARRRRMAERLFALLGLRPACGSLSLGQRLERRPSALLALGRIQQGGEILERRSSRGSSGRNAFRNGRFLVECLFAQARHLSVGDDEHARVEAFDGHEERCRVVKIARPRQGRCTHPSQAAETSCRMPCARRRAARRRDGHQDGGTVRAAQKPAEELPCFFERNGVHVVGIGSHAPDCSSAAPRPGVWHAKCEGRGCSASFGEIALFAPSLVLERVERGRACDRRGGRTRCRRAGSRA